MYTTTNYNTKKSLREALAAGEKVTVFQPGPFGRGRERGPKTVYLEGPHFPAPHSWYAEGKIDANGHLISIK